MGFPPQHKLATEAPFRFPEAPASILRLPRDRRGYPVPWFIEWIDGEPDFRIADSRKIAVAVTRQKCWICGGGLGRMKSFVIGPMCSVNRVSAEPPSHPVCAVFAAETCPFLSRPLAKRPPVDDIEARFGAVPDMPGVPLLHNPGVTLVWGCLRYKPIAANGGVLFEIGPPERLQWFREGREATRQDVLEAFEKGLPYLREMAASEGAAGVAELERRLASALELIPT